MKSILIIFTFLFSIATGYSQQKYEKEYRIKESEVPSEAINFIEKSFPDKKVKWYGEENLTGQSIEAKVKKDGNLFSVKFDTMGAIQDVEMLVKFKELDNTIKDQIENELEDAFTKYKIQKVQIQWIGAIDVLESLISERKAEGEHVTNYEIVVRGKEGRQTDYYEFLFNEKGELKERLNIIQRTDHHLIY